MTDATTQVDLAEGLGRDRPDGPLVLRLQEGDGAWEILPVAEGTPSTPVSSVLPGSSITFVDRQRLDELVRAVWAADQVPVLRAQAALHSPDRRWLRPLVGALDVPEEVRLALPGRDREAVRWDDSGVTVLTSSGVRGHWPVSVRPALTGCPVRYGEAERCRARGGPWVAASREAYRVWETARQQLVAELGCGVCGGRDPGVERGHMILFPDGRPGPG